MEDSGAATTFFSNPEMVFSPAVMIAQQGSTNWLRALLGTSTRARTTMAAATSLLFKKSQMRFIVRRIIFLSFLSPSP